MNIVFPQSNLPAGAVQWGRAVERSVKDNATSLSRIQESIQGDNRANAGQMGIIGRQMTRLQESLDELESRVTNSYNMGSLSVTSTSGNPNNSNSKSITLEGVSGGPRKAIITVSSPASTTAEFVHLDASVSLAGVKKYQGFVAERTSSQGLGYTSLTTAFSGTIPPGGATLTVRIENQIFGSTSATGTLSNIEVSTFFVDAV